MKGPKLKFLNTLGAIAVMLLGTLIGLLLVWSGAETERAEVSTTAALVTVMDAERRLASPRIEAQGTVVPARKITVKPEVSGRVTRRHPGLVAGGVVQQDEVLLEIDPRDYQLALDEAKNLVELAEAELAIEKGRQVVAEQEWERFGEQDEEPPPLALRKPQQAQAELEIARAEQRVERAELDLARTRLRAPFAALVQEADIEPGELVSPSTSAATLVALDEFWILVSVPAQALSRLAIPGRDGDQGSQAIIRHESGDTQFEHQGQIIRLLGDLDPAGRMARVIVGVEDPFSLSGDNGEDGAPDMPALRQPPLLLGSFVSVELRGLRARHVIKTPRTALHDGNRVYVATSDDTLEIREVDIAWRDAQTIAVRENLSHGERVIVSGLAAPVEGMPIRVDDHDEDIDAGQEDPS